MHEKKSKKITKKSPKDQSIRNSDSLSEVGPEGSWKRNLLQCNFDEARKTESETHHEISVPVAVQPTAPPGECGGLLSQFIDAQIKAVKLCFGGKVAPESEHVLKMVSDQLQVGAKLAEFYGSRSASSTQQAAASKDDNEEAEDSTSFVLPDFTSTHFFDTSEGERPHNLPPSIDCFQDEIPFASPFRLGFGIGPRQDPAAPLVPNWRGEMQPQSLNLHLAPAANNVFDVSHSNLDFPENSRKFDFQQGFIHEPFFGLQSRRNSFNERIEEDG